MNRRSLLIANATKGGGGELPAEYQEVEWILSDGTAYIKTTYIPQSKIDVTCTVFRPSASYASDKILFGANANGVTIYIEPYRYTGAQIGWYAKNGYASFSNALTRIGTTKLILHCYDNILTVDEEQITTSTLQTDIPNIPIYLFAWNRNGTAQYINDKMPMGRLAIKENDTVMFNVIPCYRKNDNVIGMYETVTKTFLTNETGTFSKGGDINA